MESAREAAAKGVKAVLKAAAPDAEFRRDQPWPKRPDPGGTIILHDGDPGAPEVTLSPLLYTYTHEFEIEVLGPPGSTNRHELLDQLLILIGDGIEADRSLGGVAEWAEATAPMTDDLTLENAEPVRGAQFNIVVVYSTSNPLT
ncbi:hypothetical protein [Brevundimonas naejangsanensis]|uniref:hypothetical protein n=1 Tax=Brevundimonas naejangsanensis TaxID=588932 RepID=UPI0034D4A513